MLELITARADTDGLDLCLEGIGGDLENIHTGNASARQVVLIVPAQFTLEAEEAAFRKFDAKGFFDFHIMSGARLNLQILKECGSPGTAAVNTLGRRLLLRRIAASRREEMKAFQRVCTNTEFLKMAGDFIVQMKQNQLTPADLEQIRKRTKEDSLLEKKLSDMQILAEGYEAVMAGKFNDSEDMLHFVTERMKNSSFVQNSIFWYYGFYSFTQRELDFMSALLACSGGVKVFLTLGGEEDADGEVFAAPRRAAAQLRHRARSLGQEVKICGPDGRSPRDLAPAFRHLERNLFALPPQVFRGDSSPVRLVKCSNPFTQAETIAAEILRLVREKGYSYDEIAILTEDMAGQGAAIRRACRQMGVPLFADEKRAVSGSPAVETAAALLRYAAGGRHAAGLIACLKPGLMRVPAMETDADLEIFENYCRQYHINGDRLLRPLRYGFREYGEEDMAKLEAMRAQLADLLSPFLDALEKASAVRDKCTVLYDFLARTLGLPGKLERSALELSEAGMLDAAEEQQQIWGVLCGLLDQCVELLGEDELSTADLASLLTDSFADVKVGLLPQARGSVLLGTLTRSLTGRCRALFVAGVNEGLLPKDASSDAILTQRELEILQTEGYTLAKPDKVLQEEDMLNVYRAFTRPAELLWLGWCASGADGKEMKASSLVRRVREMFPDLEEELDVESAGDDLAFLQGRMAASSRIAAAMRLSLSGDGFPSPLWQEVYDQLEDTDVVREGLLFTNQVAPLSAQQAKALYAFGDYSLSPSRLEGFACCPFRHFVNYGLRPWELKDFEISSQELGTAHHDCLKRVSEWLSEPARQGGFAMTDPKSRWMTVTREELAEKTAECAALVQKEQSDGLMQAGPKETYQAARIARVCADFAWMMVLQARKGRIADMRFEAEFRRGMEFPPIRIDTPRGKVLLEGKIDRLDLLQGPGNERYAKIIDYKSGNSRFDRTLAEKGLMLQLGIYLEAALGCGDTEPAGVFYYHIQEPELASEAENLTADAISEDLWEKLRDQYKMSGFFVDSPEIIRSIDAEVGPGESSSVMNYRLKNDGTAASGGGTSPEDFAVFRAVFRQRLEELCSRLTEGDVSIAPRRLSDTRTACTYCEVKGICSFDTAFSGNKFT